MRSTSPHSDSSVIARVTVGSLTPDRSDRVVRLGWQASGNRRWKSQMTASTARADGLRSAHRPQSIISVMGNVAGEGFRVTVMVYLRFCVLLHRTHHEKEVAH